MCVEMLKYLLRQGYLCSDICILTGYVGQLLLIRNLLSSEFVVVLSESDASAIVNEDEEGLDQLPTVEKSDLKRVWICFL
jgi:hypothetical protein